MIDIEELKRLLAEATPGEWRHIISGVSWWAGGLYSEDTDSHIANYREQCDAALIVALHNAAPAMIAELEAARKVIDLLMKAPEWPLDYYKENLYCPHCDMGQPNHAPDCPRQLTLAAWKKARGE